MLDGVPEPGLGMFSSSLLDMITRALGVLWQASCQASTLMVTAGATVLDQLAWMLHRDAMTFGWGAKQLWNLISTMFRYLGRTLEASVKIEIAVIRWVLGLLHSSVQIAGHRAISSSFQS